MNEKEKDIQLDENVQSQDKNKKSFIKSIKGFATNAYTKGTEIAKTGYEKTKDKYVEIKENREREKAISKAFEQKTYVFQIKGTYNKGELETIRAFRDTNNNLLLIPSNEPNLKLIKSKSVLITVSDASEIEIIFIEDREVEQLSLEISEAFKIDIQCFKAKFEFIKEPLEKQITNISNVVNQNVNVSGEHTGDINLISNIEVELDNFINEVINFKTKKFSKEKRNQEEAIKIIGPVKDSIISGKKDKTLMNRFLDLLISFSPILAEAFKTFM